MKKLCTYVKCVTHVRTQVFKIVLKIIDTARNAHLIVTKQLVSLRFLETLFHFPHNCKHTLLSPNMIFFINKVKLYHLSVLVIIILSVSIYNP
jgi:hypothetical protein